MTERRGDEGFAVVTQSVTGGRGRGRGPFRPRGIGVLIVLVAAIALIAVGFLGPRLSAPPNFDVSYFATPTPLPTPEPTYPRPIAAEITPLPVITRADGADLDGTIAISGDAFRLLDLATGKTTRVGEVGLWRDALFATGPDTYVCLCFVDEDDPTKPSSRVLQLVRFAGGASVTTTLDRFLANPESNVDQPDPLFDMAVDREHRAGVLAIATRMKGAWVLGVRSLDVGGASLGTEREIGRIALPPAPPGPSPTPVPSDQPVQENIYLDGPHVRMAPDGRTAVVWAVGQRYSENGEPSITQGAWRIRLGSDGAIEDVAEAKALATWPQFCPGVTFAGPDRIIALCADPTVNTSTGLPVWFLRTFDSDGRLEDEFRLPSVADYGFGEPLVDQANGRVYLWDPVGLRVVRVDLGDGSVVSSQFDAAASTAVGVTTAAARLAPVWHDGDSAVQQMLYESLAGSADGRHLYGVGMRPNQQSETYSVLALGVFVIDPATLALEARWAPAANDVWVATLPDGRVVTGGQPGMNVEGQPALWEGSLTIRDPADGRILARYGRVSTDQAPVLVRP